MSAILALDSSTEACSCALSIDGETFETFEVLPRKHTQYILPMIKRLMKEHSLNYADLDAIAVGAGPGSFTGLRIAAGVAQGLAFGAELSIIPVSTLAAMAHQSLNSTSKYVFTCLDARINEVYWAIYSIKGADVEIKGSEQLSKPDYIDLNIEDSCYAVGNGMGFIDAMPKETQALISSYDVNVYPRAGAIAELALTYFKQGKAIKPETFSPTYLRNKVTQN